MRRKFIAFSGLDCSGKSTQIEYLKDSYVKQEQKCLVFWSRGGYTPGFQKLKDILRRISGKKLPKPGHSCQREKALSNPYIRKIWLMIAILDLICYYTFYMRYKFHLNYNVICDRYLLDTNIDFKLAYPQDKTDNWFLWRLLKHTAIKPDIHFVSTIPVSDSIMRSKFKFEPFPDSPETLEKRLHFYNEELISDKNLFHIDGMKDVNQIKKYIFHTVGIL